jgi:hypothetical protein
MTTGLMTAAAMAALVAVAPPLSAQETTDASKVTLDRLYGSGDFFPDFPGRSRWLEDGSAYTALERGDLVRYDAASGEREVLVSSEQLVPEGATRPLGIQNYEWSPDGSRLLIYTNSQRVWRFNSRGDYWVLDLESGALRQMGADRPESSLMYGKFDPSGERFAYVSENDLFVENIATGEVTRLTNDGSETIINGNFDWVYEEEFFMPLPADGWRWAPEVDRVLAARRRRDRRVRHDQQHGLPLLIHHPRPVPEDRHAEFRGTSRRRERRRRRDRVVRRAGRPAGQLHPAHGVVR